MSSKKDYYDTLGISKSASAEDIKKAYRKQALEWHPDRHKEDKEKAEKKFKEINEAYQVLSNPQKKSQYDQFGHTGPQGFGGGNPFSGGFGGQNGPFTYTYSSSGGANPFENMDFGNPFDIFESFFGGASPFGRSQRRATPRYAITIDFMEAVQGVSKEVSINGKKRKIKIPAGIYDGARISFDDFSLTVSIKPHKIFQRENDDIFVNVSIPFSVAALGGEIKVPTIDGDVKIKVRAGTQSGTMMRLKERGVVHLQGRGKGDAYVKINVSIPEKLTRAQKNLVEELEQTGL